MNILTYKKAFGPWLLSLVCVSFSNASKPWTWLYQKNFSEQEIAQAGSQKVVTFTKEQVPLFSQLMFSWNAFRPAQGYFSFWVKARNSKDKSWSNWYKMIEWGANIQRSFNVSHGAIQYCHVRLEMGQDHADAFRIKIIAHEGANLSLLRAVFIAVSDFDQFQPESTEQMEDLPTLVLSNVPKKSQLMLNHVRNHGLCSPTSCSMLTSYLIGKHVDAIDFAEKSFDAGLDAYGSWPFNMAQAFDCCGGNFLFAVARLNSFHALYQRLQKGIPVVVSVRGYLQGAPKAYEKGHLLMVIGWDADTQSVICHDPAFSHDEAIVAYYPIKSFLAAWEKSHRLAYLADPL